MINDKDSVFNNCFGDAELKGMINASKMTTVFGRSFMSWIKRDYVKTQVVDPLCEQKGTTINKLMRYVVNENALGESDLWVDLDLFLEYIKAENRPAYTFMCKMVEMEVKKLTEGKV